MTLEKDGATLDRMPVVPGGASAAAEKDDLIRAMTRALRVSFKMASMYNAEHPAFKSSVNELMAKFEALFVHINPLSIGFTPHALFIDGRFWEGERTYMDLAQLFHFRKIKRMEIRPGIPHGEFMRFASKIMLPVKAFVKEGGAEAILKRENIIHISLEVLNYSQLLLGEGEEIKDIWPYLLMEAVEENDDAKLEQLSGSFEKVVGKFNTEDLIQNEELHKNFAKFFSYLKATSEEKHRTCAKQLLKTVSAARKTPTESKFENLKLLISDLTEQDLASTLWEEIIGNDKFDSLSFSIFSRIVDKERHKKIATSLRALFHTDNPQNRRSEVEKKIHVLLSGSSTQLHSEIYRQTLASLLNEISFEKKLTLDHQHLQRNYRFLLLVMLSQETKKDMAAHVLGRIAEEWVRVVQEGDFEFMTDLYEVLESRAIDLGGEPGFAQIRADLAGHIEGCLLRGETMPELNAFIDKLGTSLHAPEVYLDTIFKDRIVSPLLMKACLRFFPDRVEEIHLRIKKKASDSELLERITDGLRAVDTPASLGLLKKIYTVGDLAVKVRALQAMRDLKEFDEAFLFPILEKRNELIQAEALLVLLRHARTKHVAFTKLFRLTSPYGIRNKTLLRNLRIVEAHDLRDAIAYIEPLSKRKDFWNRKVRQEAGRILEKWHAG